MDSDAVIAVRVTPEVNMRICWGFDFKEIRASKYKSPYFGLNFNLNL